MIVSVHDEVPFVSHLPFLFDRSAGKPGTLIGHLARANPHGRILAEQRTTLAVFQGPHAYISPAWYASPGVPTWNYAVVHAYGTPRLIEDSVRLETILERLTAVHESRASIPWTFDLNGEQRSRLLDRIVGFEIEVTELRGKFKLSQNRSLEDQSRIIEQLAQSESSLEISLSMLMAARLNSRS